MSLVKIPCLIAIANGVVVAATPPTPPPQKEEVITPTFTEFVRTRVSPKFAQSLVSLFAVLEIVSIVGHVFPNIPYASSILSYLMPHSRASTLTLTPMFILSTFFILLGAFIRYQCYRALGRFFTFEVAIRKDHKLITNGPYSYCRHPGYLGVISCYSGIALWLISSGGWARESGLLHTIPGVIILGVFVIQTLFAVVGLMIRMSKEDGLLRKEFGKEWDAWAANVPYLLIPGIY